MPLLTPPRYINDMLAWVHQALAGEREFVVALFGDDKAAMDGAGRSGGNHTLADEGEEEQVPEAMLTRLLSSQLKTSLPCTCCRYRVV